MNRASRVPYHQTVYDLLALEWSECPDAARQIARFEAQHGPLAASVKEWYSIPGMVELECPDDLDPTDGEGTLWHDSLPPVPGRYGYCVRSLQWVLGSYAYYRPRRVPPQAEVLNTWGFETWTWSIHFDGSDDPPVWIIDGSPGPQRREPSRHSATFSEFIARRFTKFFLDPACPSHEKRKTGPAAPHLNGLWLRAPDEPFHPPVIDFLMERFGEPDVTPRPGNVRTHTWRPAGGTVRVTAGEPTLGGGLSAWWVHAKTPQRLAEFARLLLPWGTLRDTLRADTQAGREALERAAAGA